MALAPVSLLSATYEDYPNYWLKFYTQGTTTPITMATDSTGGTTLAKAEISAGGTVPIGFIKTAGDAIFIPWVNGAYDAWIFPTEAEADANDTTNAIQIADNINADPSDLITVTSDNVNYEAANVFTGGVTRTQESKNSDLTDAADAGAVGDGTTDDTAALLAVLDAGLVCRLKAGATYKVSSWLTYSGNNSGFICDDGQATILMGQAGFNATAYNGLLANSVCFTANGIDRPILRGVHIQMESHGTSIRTAIGAAFRNCTNLDIDVEASGFSEPEFGVITVDSCIGGRCYTNVHDCSSNDNTLPSLQITGLEIDENRVSNVYSKDIDFGSPTYKNLTMGAAAIAAYGYQTDGVTLSGGADAGTGGYSFGTITVENVHEGVDIQSANNVIGSIKARDCQTIPLKLVNACTNNSVGEVNAVNTGGPVVLFAGTNTANIGPENNTIGSIVASGVASITGTGSNTAAVMFSGSAATFKPNNNKVLGVTVTDSPNMTSNVLDEAGLGNKVLDVSGVGTTSMAIVDSGQLLLNHVDMRKSPKSLMIAYLGSDQVGAVSTDRVLYDTTDEDTYSELDTVTNVGRFTSVGPMKGRASASVRVPSLGAGEYLELVVIADGVQVARARQTNDSGGARSAIVDVSTLFTLNTYGEDVEVDIITDAASLTLTGSRDLSYFHVEEI